MKNPIVLNRNFQFQRVYRAGVSYVTPAVVVYVSKRRSGGFRYGITASKKVGCAVERNRARRVVRAAIKPFLNEISGSYDIVFVCRQKAITSKSTTVAIQIKNQLVKAGILS